jgi:hypothetical protein
MKNLHSLAALLAISALTGCTSVPRVATLAPVGPSPDAPTTSKGDGYLQVYSAREPAVVNPNAMEYFWNNDFGRNAFLHAPAHTDYDVFRSDGQFVAHVRNAHNLFDPEPTRLALPPGTYQVLARAEAYDTITFHALVPVIIKPGATTATHLDQEPWQARGANPMVKLPDGRPVGWPAEPLSLAAQAP